MSNEKRNVTWTSVYIVNAFGGCCAAEAEDAALEIAAAWGCSPDEARTSVTRVPLVDCYDTDTDTCRFAHVYVVKFCDVHVATESRDAAIEIAEAWGLGVDGECVALVPVVETLSGRKEAC